MLDTVRVSIRKHSMFRRGGRVLVGVSGGPDSLALLSALVALAPELKITLRACYVDHGLRPAAARREQALVRRYGKLWGVPVTVVKARVTRRGGQSPEAAARRARYDALWAVAKRLRCRAVAIGHTADDQAETVLMWILRGTGTAGLAGIPPCRLITPVSGTGYRIKSGLRLVRPLLETPREEVTAYLKQQGIRPLLDRSNLSARFTRNRIRRDLIGRLEREYNPRLRQHLCSLAEIVRGDLDWLGKQAAAELRRVGRQGKKGIRLNRARLRVLHPALRRGVLRRAVERLQGDCSGFGYAHWVALEGLALNGAKGAADLPHGFRAEIIDGKTLLLRRSCL